MAENDRFRWGRYTDWLLTRVGYSKYEKDSFVNLMWSLSYTPFTYILPMDKNRASDGLYLREEYCRQYGYDFEEICTPCSVLEMLCALAIRITEEYIGDPSDSRPEIIFFEMISNLGLTYFDDDFYEKNPIGAKNRVQDILQTWLERRFSYNGNGAIFPIKLPKRDQRRIEIWSQMQEYISENY